MAYFDPASNPGSKPQRLSDKNLQNIFLMCFQGQLFQEESLNLQGK